MVEVSALASDHKEASETSETECNSLFKIQDFMENDFERPQNQEHGVCKAVSFPAKVV